MGSIDLTQDIAMAKKASDNFIVAEGNRLARECLWLRTERTKTRQPLVGIWGGPGIVEAPGEEWEEHTVTIDCTWLAKQGFKLNGCISVYCNEELDYIAVNDPDARLPRSIKKGQGLALYGERKTSLISDLGIQTYGSKSFQNQLKKAGKMPDAWREYVKQFQAQCPLLSRELNDVAVVVGGWHINWHDDRPLWKHKQGDEVASFDCGKNRLVLWTFREAEPWVEVWQDKAGKLHAWGLIT